ncbi:MAG: hypothetical protein ACXACR_08580, partial [Candidatus Hodarchaeales archaeon]
TEITHEKENANYTEFVIKFPSVGKKEIVSVIIKMDHPNAVTFTEDAALEEFTYPYSFNLSFIPLISLPITSYKLDWKVGKDIEGADVTFGLDNDSIQPTTELYTGDQSTDLLKMIFRNVTELSTINRSLLNGMYNLTALEGRKFIPAFSSNIAANLTLFLSFNFYQSAYTRIEFTELVSEVTVSEWGYITSKHEITIFHNGIKSGSVLSSTLGGPTEQFSIIAFHLPDGASGVGLRDNYGNLTPTLTHDPIIGKKILAFIPRIQIDQGEEYQVYLTYREKASDIISDVGGELRLNMPLSFNFNWTIRKFELNLFLPHGSSSLNFNGIALSQIVNITETITLRESVESALISQSSLLNIFNKAGVKLSFENLTPVSNNYFRIDFIIHPFNFLTEPLSIIILIFSAGLIYTILRNLSFGFKPKKYVLEEIPLENIKRFVKAYEEKTAIREQVLRLDRKRKSKNISAREYEQTLKILRNQQQRIERSIVTVSRKLSEKSPRYRISMRSIEIAEASREDILLNIESLERRKAQGRIGKEAYAKLKVNYDKNLRKSNNEIDKVLIDLRSLLTK